MKAKRIVMRICLLCAVMLPAVAQAQFNFTMNAGNTITVIGYTGLGGAVTIPGTINGLPVTGIGTNAFSDCTGLNSAAIPNNVTSIGSFAFAGCTNLISIFFGSNAPSADSTAFTNDSNTSIYCLPGTTGWSSTFEGIQTVLLPYTYTASNGVIAITGYAGPGGQVTIPGSIGGLPVISIGANAFAFCGSLTGVAIPDNLFNIGSGAFYSCTNLTSVTIGNGVTNVSSQAFYLCTSLTNVTFGNGITSIGNYAFQYCGSLAGVTIPAGFTSIGSSTFANCTGLNGAYFQGNAPYNGGSAFASDSGAIVYYLVWSAKFMGRFIGFRKAS